MASGLAASDLGFTGNRRYNAHVGSSQCAMAHRSDFWRSRISASIIRRTGAIRLRLLRPTL